MSGKRPGYLGELYRTGGGAVADTIDGVTGFPNAMLGLVGSKYRTPQTNLGPMVPQPWATGNQIVRSVAPLMVPGSQEFGAFKVDRAAAPVLQSAVDTGVNGMLRRRDVIAPRVENRTAHRAVDLGRQDIENATTAGYQDFNRRQVTKGIAAAGAAAVAGPKMLNKMMPEAVKVAKAASTVKHSTLANLLDKASEGGYADAVRPVRSLIRAHTKALKQTGDTLHQVAIDNLKKYLGVIEVHGNDLDGLAHDGKWEEAANPAVSVVDQLSEDAYSASYKATSSMTPRQPGNIPPPDYHVGQIDDPLQVVRATRSNNVR